MTVDLIGRFVLVRTRSAGVHCGTLLELGSVVQLEDARRIWRWRGANTLNELSISGCDNEWSRISEPVRVQTLLDAIEVIACEEPSIESLSRSRWPA